MKLQRMGYVRHKVRTYDECAREDTEKHKVNEISTSECILLRSPKKFFSSKFSKNKCLREVILKPNIFFRPEEAVL